VGLRFKGPYPPPSETAIEQQADLTANGLPLNRLQPNFAWISVVRIAQIAVFAVASKIGTRSLVATPGLDLWL
jgi:hypothetical protein